MTKTEFSSFRDPSGNLFWDNQTLYRYVNFQYSKQYDHLMKSGLYEELTKKKLLIPHEEIPTEEVKQGTYKLIKPEFVSFISYPYEWSFTQLKDAALTTLKIQDIAFKYGMTLKDASAFNIQFFKGKTVLIDTLSFEFYKEGQVWIPYRQFCRHFLAPLALMAHRDIRLNQLLKTDIDGIDLEIASKLLPFSTRMQIGLLTHIHLHAKSEKKYASSQIKGKEKKISKLAFLGLIDNLKSTVGKCRLKKENTVWGDYYNETNYSSAAMKAKRDIVSDFVDLAKSKSVWDLGANTGEFSRITSTRGIPTVSFDFDPLAIEKNYLTVKENSETCILPLLLDLTNPSPAIGWSNRERHSLMERKNADTIIALALIHHLAISNNLPLPMIADFFHELCDSLIIEFVPKSDSQVKILLASREDIFDTYTRESFEDSFSQYFSIEEKRSVPESERTIYLMKNK